ncbi:MAG: hypothetical protein IKA30_00295, partial [Alphaproteobacteria bacterium]|nr:hypothetical protein [Alphaproteobacteria bacterium]
MSDKLKLILGGILFAVVVILFETMFIINQTEQAIVLQFGEPVREIKQAGLKFKIPFIQKVVIYDNRLLNLEPPAQEVVLNDKKRQFFFVHGGQKITDADGRWINNKTAAQLLNWLRNEDELVEEWSTAYDKEILRQANSLPNLTSDNDKEIARLEASINTLSQMEMLNAKLCTHPSKKLKN